MALPAPKQSTRTNYWRDRTEQDLLKYEFTTKEPEKLEGMSDAPIIPGAVIIEFAYDLSGRLTGKAKCVHCKYPNHYRGFVIRLADGSRRQVGKDCGRTLYGGEFDELHKDFETARKLAGSLKWRTKLLAAEPILTDGLARLGEHRAFGQFNHMTRRIHYVLGDQLISSLQHIVMRGEYLTVPEKVRDFAAEERSHQEIAPEHIAKLSQLNKAEQRRYRRRHALPNSEIYKWLNRSLGALKGAALIRFHTGPQFRIEQLRIDIANCFGGLRQERAWSSTSLSESSQRLTDLVSKLEKEIEKLRSAPEFFEHSNLAAVCEWAAQRPDASPIRCGPGWLERENEYGDSVRAELTADYDPPSAVFVNAFREAVG